MPNRSAAANEQEREDVQQDEAEEEEETQRILNMVMEYVTGAEVEYPEAQDRKQFKIKLPTAANTLQQYKALRERLGSRDAPRPKCRFQSCATAGARAKFRYFNNSSSQTLQLRYRCLACRRDFTLGGRQNTRTPYAAAAPNANARRSTRLTTVLQQQQQQIHAAAVAAASVPSSLYPHHHHHHHHYHHQFQLQLYLQQQQLQQQQQQLQLGIGPSSLNWARGSSSSSAATAAENVPGISAVHGQVQPQQGDAGNNNNNNNNVQDDQLNALLTSPAYGDLGTNIFILLKDSGKDSNKK